MNKIHYCPVGLIQRQFGIYVTGAGMEETKPGEPYPHAYHSSDYYFTWRKGRALTDWEYQILYIRSGEGEIEFEPDTRHCLIYMEAAYLRTDVYFALVDSAAAEQGARRTAMKSATDNATEMIATLTKIYNRERQGAITTEISEIVGGAAALEE